MNIIEIQAGLTKTAGYLYVMSETRRESASRVRTGCKQRVREHCRNEQSPQTGQQCLANLTLVLKCHKFNWDDIQKLTIYVVGTRDNLNAAWCTVREKFPNGVPPATLSGRCASGIRESTGRNRRNRCQGHIVRVNYRCKQPGGKKRAAEARH
jgi:hypothetical protein